MRNAARPCSLRRMQPTRDEIEAHARGQLDTGTESTPPWGPPTDGTDRWSGLARTAARQRARHPEQAEAALRLRGLRRDQRELQNDDGTPALRHRYAGGLWL